MIRARHRLWAKTLFYPYIYRIIRKDFSAFHIAGPIPDIPENRALLLTPNHTGWWDGFFVHTLNRSLWRRKFYLMMLEEQLRRYWYFSRIGCYSLNPGSPSDVYASFEYTSRLLSRPENIVVIFPEGELHSQFLSPYHIRKGVSRLAAWTVDSTPFSILPVTFLIQPYKRRAPELIAGLGAPLTSEELAEDYSVLEQSMRENWLSTIEASKTRGFSYDIFPAGAEYPHPETPRKHL